MVRVERILFLVALVALGWYATARGSVMFYQASQNRQLEQLRLERDDLSLPAPATSASPESPAAAASPEPLAPSAPSAAAASSAPPATPARRRTPLAGPLIGRIDIPRLGVSAIVSEGVDDRTLRRAVGHIPGTALPGHAGNVALAAHRDTFFGPLQWARTGDRIRVRTPDGDVSYVVSETRVVEPNDLSVLEPTPDQTLTLITCYPFSYVGPAPQRFIVRARAVDR